MGNCIAGGVTIGGGPIRGGGSSPGRAIVGLTLNAGCEKSIGESGRDSILIGAETRFRPNSHQVGSDAGLRFDYTHRFGKSKTWGIFSGLSAGRASDNGDERGYAALRAGGSRYFSTGSDLAVNFGAELYVTTVEMTGTPENPIYPGEPYLGALQGVVGFRF